MRPDAKGRAKAIEAEAEQPAKRLRAARKALGLSQTQFAELIDTPVATLRDWEQGRFKPPGSALVLCRIALTHPEALLPVAKASNVLQYKGEKTQEHRHIRAKR